MLKVFAGADKSSAALRAFRENKNGMRIALAGIGPHGVVGIAALIGDLISDLFFIEGIVRFGLCARLLADERVLRRPGGGADPDSEYPRCDSEGVIQIGCDLIEKVDGEGVNDGSEGEVGTVGEFAADRGSFSFVRSSMSFAEKPVVSGTPAAVASAVLALAFALRASFDHIRPRSTTFSPS